MRFTLAERIAGVLPCSYSSVPCGETDPIACDPCRARAAALALLVELREECAIAASEACEDPQDPQVVIERVLSVGEPT